MDRKKNLINSISWGFLLWLIGYILGIIFFMIMPANMIGWAITPVGIIITLWVLITKIKREQFMCYIGLGVIWTAMAIILDYIFIVKLFHSANYYKVDVFIYYALTLILPILVGVYRMKLKPSAK